MTNQGCNIWSRGKEGHWSINVQGRTLVDKCLFIGLKESCRSHNVIFTYNHNTYLVKV